MHIFPLWVRKQLLPAPARFPTKRLKKIIVNAHVNSSAHSLAKSIQMFEVNAEGQSERL